MENVERFDILLDFLGTSILCEQTAKQTDRNKSLIENDQSILFQHNFEIDQLQQQDNIEIDTLNFGVGQEWDYGQNQVLPNEYDSNLHIFPTFSSCHLEQYDKNDQEQKQLIENIKNTEKLWIPFYAEYNTDDLMDDCPILDSNEFEAIADYLVEMSN